MTLRFKKIAWFLVALGLVLILLGGYFGWREYSTLRTGEQVSAQVTRILESKNMRGDTLYRPEFEYLLNNKAYAYRPAYRFRENPYHIGDRVDIYVKQGNVSIKEMTPLVISIMWSFVSGLIFFIIGLVWLTRQHTSYHQNNWLKRYGKKVRARFAYEEIAPYKLDGEDGYILFFRKEKGDQIFQSQPIFSEFTIRSLQEHVFDVYVHPKKPQIYYIDIEKLFGAPRPHRLKK